MRTFLRHTVPLAAVLTGYLSGCGAEPTAAALAGGGSDTAALSTREEAIVDAGGNPVALHGLNWFGFNNGGTMVNGVWGGSPLAQDFATVVYRQQLLGFNAVRLPFSFQDLENLKPNDFSADCKIPTPDEVAASITGPGNATLSPIPPQIAPPKRDSQRCNSYLPNDSVWNRYKWVVQFYAKNGFYVLVDNHFREDKTLLDRGTDVWAAKWAKLVGEIASEPAVKDHLLVDLLNEPDQYGLAWEARGGKPGLTDAYIAAMDAIHKVAPDVVFLVEGAGQANIQTNWGDGFATDQTLIARTGISDASPFFRAVLAKPYRHNLVLAPHVYGPLVTTNYKATHGAELYDRLSSSFGYITKDGFCDGDDCSRFPVAIGEFGSFLTNRDDTATMTDLVAYLNNTGDAADGRHSAIPNWFWWSWNPNSGDTGGLVGDDWVAIEWNKITLLRKLGLTARGDGTPPQAPPPPPTPGTPLPAPTPTPSTTSAPEGEPAPFPIPEAKGDASCAVDVAVQSSWEEGGKHRGVLVLTVANHGEVAIAAPWTVTLTGGDFVAAPQAWNWLVSVQDGKLVGQVSGSWQGLSPHGGAVTLGVIAESGDGTFAPTGAEVGGTACTVTVH